MDIQGKLEQVFQDVFNDETMVLRDEMIAQDVPGWDSLSHINLMFGIESAFGIQFQGNELAEFKNIGELKAYLSDRVS